MYREGITINSERLSCSPLRLGTRQGCPLLPPVSSIVPVDPAIAIGNKRSERCKDGEREKQNRICR